MPGFVDRINGSGLSGWYAARGTKARNRPRAVVISVNDIDRFCAFCQDSRPDVVQAGASRDPNVGFQAPLTFETGDLVRARSLADGMVLNKGVAVIGESRVRARSDVDGFLPIDVYGELPAFRRALEALRPRFEIVAFRPLFGQTGALSAVAIQTPERRLVISLAFPMHRARRLESLYKRVLEPSRVPCPGIEMLADPTGGVTLGVDYVAGETLDKLGIDAEPAIRRTIECAKRLNALKPPSELEPGLRERSSADRIVGRNWRQLLAGQRRRDFWLLAGMLWVAGRLPRVFSHGDLHRDNVIIEAGSGRPMLIDWDRAGILPVGFDLSRLLLGVPPRQAEAWIGGSRELRLGWAIFTYLALALRQPDFIGSDEARYLGQRFVNLSRPRLSARRPVPR